MVNGLAHITHIYGRRRFVRGGVGFILGLTGLGDSAGAVGAILGWLISIPCSIWGLNSALHKKHKGYALRLVKVE